MMSCSGPAHYGPDEHEPLKELFGTVFDLADEIASRTSPDEVEDRLRRTLESASLRRQKMLAAQENRRFAAVGSPGDYSSVAVLVTRAAEADQDAWNWIVERYAPLVHSICLRYRLTRHEAEDVAQRVWLLLVEHIGELREPAALPGWLATTTAHECLRIVRAHRPDRSLADSAPPANDVVIDDEILRTERNEALRAAFAELPLRCQRLLSMLISDPPHSYAEISAALDIPVGSIGPQRSRCLERLRRSMGAYLDGGEIKVNIRGEAPGR
jgi:RNA polymerase sigma factor (sigma-70 family)